MFLVRRGGGIVIVLTHFQQYFSYIVVVIVFGGGNRDTCRKPDLSQVTDKLDHIMFVFGKVHVCSII